jgi:prepilin-type N-terminal cleavage/methylation domain-containing protein
MSLTGRGNFISMMKRGFTLIEIIISLAILAIGIVGILSLFPVGFDSARRSIDIAQATLLAQQKLAEIRKDGFPATGATGPTPFTSDPYYSWTQVTTDVRANYLRRVDLTVGWNYRGRNYQETFTTYVARKN